jgi:hypothetical protein
MLETSLRKYNFPMDKLEESQDMLILIKGVYNQMKKKIENKKKSRQTIMDEAVVQVYNAFKENLN